MLDFGDRDIDRPLGMGAKPPRRPMPGDGRRLAFVGLLVAAIAGGSLLTAAHDDGLRSPAPVVVAQTAPEAPSEPAVEREAPASPSITRIGPQTGDGGSSIVVIRDPSSLQGSGITAHLPDPDLIEEGDAGLLPRRGENGLRPFDAYARPWSGARGARVAIVIGGLGLSQTGTQRAIEILPEGVTLAFSPQGNSLDRWMQTARREGHELLMQIPLEPFDYPAVDPGRGTLTVEADAETRRADLHWVLSRITNYTGVMNYMGGRFTADAPSMAGLMAELSDRGLGYLDDGSSARSVAAAEAQAGGVPFAAADTAIDGVREKDAIMKKLDELERVARAKGFAVGVGAAFDVTIDAVAAWISEAGLRGIEIVPYSAVADDPERR